MIEILPGLKTPLSNHMDAIVDLSPLDKDLLPDEQGRVWAFRKDYPYIAYLVPSEGDPSELYSWPAGSTLCLFRHKDGRWIAAPWGERDAKTVLIGDTIEEVAATFVARSLLGVTL